jgi:phosphate transport system permease protein
VRISPKITQRFAWGYAWAAVIIAVAVLLFIVLYVIIKGAPVINWEFLTTPPGGGLGGEGGISSSIVTTLWLIGTTMVMLVPLGLGAAIYMAEYARDNWFTGLIRYSVELLAGVPSIVFGLFGFAVLVLALHTRPSIMAGAFTLTCLLLPFMMRSAEEAMKSVPQSQREAALALGATKWQTVTQVVIPGALPGIITGIILCAGGAVAESACLYVTMGGSTRMPTSFLSGGRTLAVEVFYLATETNALDKALATGAILIIIILIINLFTKWAARRIEIRMRGGHH